MKIVFPWMLSILLFCIIIFLLTCNKCAQEIIVHQDKQEYHSKFTVPLPEPVKAINNVGASHVKHPENVSSGVSPGLKYTIVINDGRIKGNALAIVNNNRLESLQLNYKLTVPDTFSIIRPTNGSVSQLHRRQLFVGLSGTVIPGKFPGDTLSIAASFLFIDRKPRAYFASYDFISGRVTAGFLMLISFRKKDRFK